MLHTTSTARSARRPLSGALAILTLTLAACSAGAAAPSPTAVAEPGGLQTPNPTPTAVPGDPGGGTGGGTDPGSGGGTGGNPGSGILPPGITFPVAPVPDESLLGEAKYLTAVKDLINQRNANIQLLRAAVADGKAFADLRWYSGVEPCNALDSVKVVTDEAAKTIHLTVVEGSGPGDQMCIEIAELHAVAVDLGVLASGTWTISAEGDAPAIKLDVP